MLAQVYLLGSQLKLDRLMQSAQATVLAAEWEGENVHRLLAILHGQACSQMKALLHHPSASAFSELQVGEHAN